MTFVCSHFSPIGSLLLVSDGVALTELWLDAPAELRDLEPSPNAAPFDEVRRQLDAYFAGTLTRFDLPLAPEGTPFQERVWRALCELPYGVTTSYGAIAHALGRDGAARAVGLANGRNPIAIIIPCHRVIGASGSLTGYGGGLERKRWLLEHEARHASPRDVGPANRQAALPLFS